MRTWSGYRGWLLVGCCAAVGCGGAQPPITLAPVPPASTHALGSRSAQSSPGIALFGSDDGAMVWVNGQRVHRVLAERAVDPEAGLPGK